MTKNLLTGEINAPEPSLETDQNAPLEIISYWSSNITFGLVLDHTQFKPGGMPHQVEESLTIHESGAYFPYLFKNDFWVMTEDLFPINETVTSLDLHLSYEPISLFKWQMFSQLDKSFQTQSEYGLNDANPDEFKRMLRDTNPFLLGLTFAVTLLHSVFDFLAFKNGI